MGKNSNREIDEKEHQRLTEISRLTRMGFACFIAPALSIIIMIVLLELSSIIAYIPTDWLSAKSIGIMLFGGTVMAYFLMFFIGLPAMMFLENVKSGTLVNYILVGIFSGTICNLIFWFMSIDQSSFYIQAAVICAALSWGIMNIGNKWNARRYW